MSDSDLPHIPDEIDNPPYEPPETPMTYGTVGTPPDPAGAAPVNIDVPYVAQDGAALASTMGNWSGEPDTYSYQWQLDGVDAGTDADTYAIVAPDDVGKTAVCVVSATNAIGTTAAPPSNAVIIADPGV